MANKVDEIVARRPTKEFAANLSAEKIAEFRQSGFTRIDRITTDEEVDWLRELYDLLFSGEIKLLPGALVTDVSNPIENQRGLRISQVLRPEHFIPALRETQFCRNGRAIATQLLGTGAEVEYWGHMVRKAPRDTESVPWHQDEGYSDPSFDYDAFSCWMPLDPATIESGCMSFIPGSHKGHVLRHGFAGGDPTITTLVLEEPVDLERAVPQPVAIGGASFHHNRTLHGSGPNTSERPRRAYVNEWQAKPVARAKPHERDWYWTRQKMLREKNNKLEVAI